MRKHPDGIKPVRVFCMYSSLRKTSATYFKPCFLKSLRYLIWSTVISVSDG